MNVSINASENGSFESDWLEKKKHRLQQAASLLTFSVARVI